MSKMVSLLSYLSLPIKGKMNRFFVEKRTRLNKMRIVHRNNCDLLPEEEGRIDLGNLTDLKEVVTKAQMHYPKIEICKYCISYSEGRKVE